MPHQWCLPLVIYCAKFLTPLFFCVVSLLLCSYAVGQPVVGPEGTAPFWEWGFSFLCGVFLFPRCFGHGREHEAFVPTADDGPSGVRLAPDDFQGFGFVGPDSGGDVSF